MPFSVQSFKSKISFCDVPEGKHGILLKSTGGNKLYARTLFRVFIAHLGLHDEQIPDLKARIFSREYKYLRKIPQFSTKTTGEREKTAASFVYTKSFPIQDKLT